MQPLSLEELVAARDPFDTAAAAMRGVDTFCCTTDWGLSAHEAFMPDRTPRLYRAGHGHVTFMEQGSPDGGRIWWPFEPIWGLGCPFVGPDVEALIGEALPALAALPSWDLLVVTGGARDAPVVQTLAARLPRRLRLGLAAPPVLRCLIDLEGGWEAFLGRRSRNLRRGALRALARAEAAGVTFETTPAAPADPHALYERLLAVERQSWKGEADDGLIGPEMQAFYRAMVPRLASRGRLLLTFARLAGEDVGYILGARLGNVYRGLQFSYLERHAALGLGNALQLQNLQAAAEAGIALYDLGAEVEYKRRWCDRTMEALTLVVRR